jgi:serine/threonine protein kinase
LARSLNASRATATLSGTPHYVAPERIRGEPATPASDVYGLGILLYEMLTGRVPWDGAVEAILQGHIEQEPMPPSTLIDGGLDPAVEQLILRALAKSPADRHKDMAAFIYELRTVIDMLGYKRRDKGPSRRIVIERSANTRDSFARLAFDGCRLPLALLGADGLILASNPAFSRFVMGVAVDIENLPLQDTPLAAAWTTSAGDITRTLKGHPVRRVLEISAHADAQARRLLLWLDAVSRDQVIVGVQPIET